MAHRLLLVLLLLASLVGCQSTNPTGSTSASNLRPVGAPDVVVIAFGGRCSWITNLSCVSPYDNQTYLEDASHSARQEVEQAFRDLGYSVQSFDASAFVDSHFSYVSAVNEPGYADAEAYLEQVERAWIANYDNPTQVVLLAHSHGTVWASLLAWNHPEVQFAYIIYLDAICTIWPDDNMINHPLVQDYFHSRGADMPWPLEITNTPCDLTFQGLSGTWDLNDLIPWNATYGLEVRSENGLPNVTWDDDPNARPDGTATGLASFYSAQENHGQVSTAGSDAMTWVYQELELNGLPVATGLNPQSMKVRPQVRRAPSPAPEPLMHRPRRP